MHIYLINLSLTWIVLLLIYKLFFEKEKFFTINRFYLLFSLVAGLLLPLIGYIDFHSSADITTVIPQVNSIYQSQLSAIELWYGTSSYDEQVLLNQEVSPEIINWNWSQAFLLCYIIGILVVTIKLLTNLLTIAKIIRNSKILKYDTHCEIITNSVLLPFSFFNYIFIGNNKYSDTEKKDILTHEMHHIRAGHSMDVIFIELLKIIFWWNPIIYLYKLAVIENHEYSADAAVISVTSRKEYCSLLLQSTFPEVNLELSNPIFQSFIKKRITMMYQTQSKKKNAYKYGISIIALGILCVLFIRPVSAQDSEWTNVARKMEVERDINGDFPKEVIVNQKGVVYTEGIDYVYNKHNGALYLADNVYAEDHPVHVGYKDKKRSDELKFERIFNLGLENKNNFEADKYVTKEKSINNNSTTQADTTKKWNVFESCNVDANGYYFMPETVAKLPSCPPDADPADYNRKALSEYALQNFKITEEAVVEGFIGSIYTGFHIDENGKIESFIEHENLPMRHGMDHSMEKLTNEMMRDIIFEPATCNGKKVKSLIHFSFAVKIPDHKKHQIKIRNATTVVPQQAISIQSISKYKGAAVISYHYRSNMNAPTTITIQNPEGEIIEERKYETMYRKIYKGADILKEINGRYKVMATQDGQSVSSYIDCSVF